MSQLVSKFTEAYIHSQSSSRRKRFLEEPEVREEFDSSRPEIEDLLGRTKYYHGTGAIHYENDGTSKYDGEGTSLYRTTDSLANFIQNGLEIRHDFYNTTMSTGVEASLSLTERRLYARLYAQSFLAEGHELEYEYGRKDVWWLIFLTRMTLLEIRQTGFSQLVKQRKLVMSEPGYQEKRADRLKKMPQWCRSFRNDDLYQQRPWASVVQAKSTIPENFPLILGIKDGTFDPLPQKFPGVASYEIRSGASIESKSFTHFQVPFANVQGVRQKVQQLGMEIPVIAIEFAELIDSEQPLDTLIQYHSPITSSHNHSQTSPTDE